MKEIKRDEVYASIAGVFPVIWIALRIAPQWTDNLFELIGKIDVVFAPPLYKLVWTERSLGVVLFCITAYAVGVGILFTSRKNYRRGEEHGSARWGNPSFINRKYRQHPASQNKILTQNVRIGFNAHKHRRNLNVLVIGGSGAGKTRFYVKPNVMQANCSMVILDPKGEILRDTGWLLTRKGYSVKVLDLINMERSHCYNPFVYLRNDNDIQRLVTNLFKSTTPKGAQSSEPFWDNAAQMLLLALIFYLKYEAPEEEQNFAMVMEMLRAGDVDEEDSKAVSALDILFENLREDNPDHIALKYYDAYHSGSGKTLKSIQITLIARLEKFNLPSLAGITQTDEMRLNELGEKPGVIFALIPDNDTSYNFIIGMLYTQLFQQLYRSADFDHGGCLPRHVHFIMDEFANCCLPDGFDRLLTTMRSRGISVSIIIQNLAQIRALYEKTWENITGNCDMLLYLGGNEQSTHEYMSKLIGKQTIDVDSDGVSKGRQGSHTKNHQTQARELMTPDEVGRLDNQYAILHIKGEYDIIDRKYDLLKHPNIKMSADGGAPMYIHGNDVRSKASIGLVGDDVALRSNAVDIETLFTEEEKTQELEVISYLELE